MNPILTGILSFGMSGRIFHAPFVNEHPGFRFQAVTERHEKKVADSYDGVTSYDSVDELLNDPAIELIIVNTPSYTHTDLAKKCLLAGKHVLVEKPFAPSAAAARELFDLARQQGKSIMAYQNRRWDSDFLSVKEVIESGRLGRLIEVNFRFDRYKKDLQAKKFKEDGSPGSGLTYDLGPHLLDQVISLFGQPTSSSSVTGKYRPGTLVTDYVSWRLAFPGGVHVNVSSSLLTAQPVPSFVLHGENGSYIKSRTDVQEQQLDKSVKPGSPGYGVEPEAAKGVLTTVDPAGEKNEEQITAPAGNYLLLFDAVYEQIRNGVPFPVTEQDIICQMELLEQAG